MSYTPEKNKEYLNARYESQRQTFYTMLGGKCVVCGTTEDLQIDHIDWVYKSFAVGALWPKKNLPAVYKELKKCQLLCELHHIQKTKSDKIEYIAIQPGFVHGTVYAWMKKKCRCSICMPVWRAWHDERNAKRRK